MREIEYRQPILSTCCDTKGFQYWKYNGQFFCEEEFTPCKCGKNKYEIFGDIEQFIGIKDKNGVKIFKNDIVKGNNNICVVFYNELRAMYALEYITDNETEKCLYPFDDWDMFEVIGNIHQNPELLESKQ